MFAAVPRPTSIGRLDREQLEQLRIESKRIEQLLKSEEWNRMAATNSQGYDDPNVTTPRKTVRSIVEADQEKKEVDEETTVPSLGNHMGSGAKRARLK